MKMSVKDKKNKNLTNFIKKAHGLLENADIEKHRQSQDYLGTLLTNKKDLKITPIDIDGMYAEWVCVERSHSNKCAILYCHGGGYSTGSSLYARTITTKLAFTTSIDVLAFDYRLAPENPYPAALEDAMRAWNYLLLKGYGAREIIIIGDSAGGNLALSLTHKLKQESRILPKSLILLSPWTDLLSTGKSHLSRIEQDPILNEEYLNIMIKNYADGEDMKNPLISPLYGNFRGFPPTYIQVGDNEILLNDSTQLHKKMIKDDVLVRIDVFKDMWHVFQMSPFKTANDAMDRIAQFIFNLMR